MTNLVRHVSPARDTQEAHKLWRSMQMPRRPRRHLLGDKSVQGMALVKPMKFGNRMLDMDALLKELMVLLGRTTGRVNGR